MSEFLRINQITFPPRVLNISDLIDDFPFKANVTIVSAEGKLFLKNAESSMFSKNWSKERIIEEMMYVYEKTFIQKTSKSPRKVNDFFDKFEFFDSNNN